MGCIGGKSVTGLLGARKSTKRHDIRGRGASIKALPVGVVGNSEDHAGGKRFLTGKSPRPCELAEAGNE